MFTAGICTTVMRTLLPSCISSVRTDSVKPLTACLAPQYALLQRDGPVTERRADLDDGAAITGPHRLQRHLRPVDVTQVADLGDPLEFLAARFPRTARTPR